MDQIKTIMRTQLSEAEVMIYLLMQNGDQSSRQIANALGMTHMQVYRTYKKAELKMAEQAERFKTPVGKV